MALNFDSLSLLALISTSDLVANEIFYHTSCYKLMQFKSDKLKRDKSSTDWNSEWKKTKALVYVLSYIVEQEESNPSFECVFKDINQKYIDCLSELEILKQSGTTRITDKFLNAFPNLCLKSNNKESFFLFPDTASTLIKDYIESPGGFFIALRKILLLVQKNLLSRKTVFYMN